MINIADLELFPERDLMNHVNSLMFEREAGTKGENKSITYIQKVISQENIENKIEIFKWSKTITIFAKLILIFLILGSLTSGLFKVFVFFELFFFELFWLMILIDSILIIIIILMLKDLFDMTNVMLIGRRKKSTNLIPLPQSLTVL